MAIQLRNRTASESKDLVQIFVSQHSSVWPWAGHWSETQLSPLLNRDPETYIKGFYRTIKCKKQCLNAQYSAWHIEGDL